MDSKDDTEDIAARADWGGDSESMADVLRDTQVETEAAALDEMADSKGGSWPEDVPRPPSYTDAVPTDPRKAPAGEAMVKREAEDDGTKDGESVRDTNGSSRRREKTRDKRRDDGERDRKERRGRDRSDSTEYRRRRRSRSRSSSVDSYRDRRFSQRESSYTSRDRDRDTRYSHDLRNGRDGRDRDDYRDPAREEADRTRSGGWGDKREDDWQAERGHPGHGNPPPKRVFASASRIFSGTTLFVLPQRRGLPKDPISPLELIKSHGGRLCPDPSADRCNFIVIPYNPALPKDIVARVDLQRSHSIDEMLNIRDWKSENMVRYFARTVGEVPPYERRMPKIVLRQDWLHACIEAGRILGEEDGWGGLEVRASYDPSLAYAPPSNAPPNQSNGPSFSDSNRVPLQSRDQMGPIGRDGREGRDGRDGPGIFDARKDESSGNSGWGQRPPADTLQRSPPNPSNANPWQQPPPFDPRRQHNSSGLDNSAAAAPPFSRPSPAAPLQPEFFPPTPQRSASGFGGPIAGANGPAPVSAGMVAFPVRQAETSAPPAGKLFSFAGVLPIGFYVEGPPASRKPIEMLITRDGGGTITTSDRAAIIVLPLVKSGPPSDPQHLQLIQQLASEPGRIIISQDWVFDSIEAGSLASLREYAVPTPAPAPAPAATAPGGGAHGWNGSGSNSGVGAPRAGYDRPTMPGIRSYSDAVGPPGYNPARGAPALSPAGISVRGAAGAAGAGEWGRKRQGEDVERDVKRRDEGRQPIPFPQMDAPSSFEDVDPVHQIPMGMLIDGLRRWSPRTEWPGLLESLAVYPEDRQESAKQVRYIDNLLNLYPRTLERSVPGLSYRQLMGVWTRNVGEVMGKGEEY